MERIDSCRILATKIAYISNIMIYYGYVHECAELYKQLCSDSREEWNKNAKAIVKVIMKDRNLRCKLDFKGDFTHRIAKFLETNNTYNYYRIGVLLNNEGCRYLIEFIRKLDYYSEDLFYKVLIQCNKCDFYLIQRFMEVYFSQGLDKKALKLIRIPYFSKRIMYVDRLIMSIYSEIEWDIKECYTLSLNIFTFSNNNINSDIILKKNLPKLKDIKYHNLDLSVSEIKLMIDYFGDFDSERNIFESINSDSCIRLILNLKDYFRPNAEEFKIKYLAWICARFPSIKEIESNSINNIIGFTILKHIVFCEDEKYLKYLKQINKIVCKQYWSYFDQDSFIFINKLNIKLGVCINGKIAICKVNRLTINCKMESVQFTQSDLNKNQQYLLFKLDKIRFKIEGIQTDINCSEDEHSSYMKIMTNFVSESNDGRSLLFIFPIEKITIPKNINDMPILLNIYINDGCNPTYRITFSQDKINKEFESFIDSLDNHSKVVLNVVENYKLNDILHTKILEIENKTLCAKNKGKEYLSALFNVWNKLFSKNIVDLQVQDVIKSKPIFDLFINFLSGHDQRYKSRLNFLELKLENTQEVNLTLEALKFNFVVKTIKLDTQKRVNAKTEEKAEEFLSQRVASKICLNSKMRKFKLYLQKNFELKYPSL